MQYRLPRCWYGWTSSEKYRALHLAVRSRWNSVQAWFAFRLRTELRCNTHICSRAVVPETVFIGKFAYARARPSEALAIFCDNQKSFPAMTPSSRGTLGF